MKIKICNLATWEDTYTLAIVIEKEELSLLYLCSKVFPPAASRSIVVRPVLSDCERWWREGTCRPKTSPGEAGTSSSGRRRDCVTCAYFRRHCDKKLATRTDRNRLDGRPVGGEERGKGVPLLFVCFAGGKRILSVSFQLLRLRSLASLWSPMLRRLLRLKVVSSSAAGIVGAITRNHVSRGVDTGVKRVVAYFNYREAPRRRRVFVVILSVTPVTLCDLVVIISS